MKQYRDAVKRILSVGSRRTNTRGGIDTIGVFNHNYTHDLANGIPLLTTKKISWKNIVVENLWFLSGDPTVDFLHQHGVHFWDPWILYQPVITAEFNTSFYEGSEYPSPAMYRGGVRKIVPSAYGSFWRNFDGVDQIAWVIDKLTKDKNTRQACVTSWDPRNTNSSGLPPCHVFHVLNYYEGRLNLHLTQRSCDTALGLPYNMAGYGGFMLPLYGRLTGLEPGIFAHSIVDMHVYTVGEDGSNAEYDHIPGLATQMARDPRKLPTMKIDDRIQSLKDIEDLVTSKASTEELLNIFKLEGYDPHPAINFKPAV